MTATPAHDHRPLWVTGHIRATCRAHFWQSLALSATAPVKAGVR